MFLLLAAPSTCAFSDSVQEMKSQAAAACWLFELIPSTSPPTNDDEPPVSPGIGATPTWRSGPSLMPCRAVAPIGWMPTRPSPNSCVQVVPDSFFADSGTTPSSYSWRSTPYTFAASGLSIVDAVPCSLSTVPPDAQIIGQLVNSW